jgi:hypothetical protein
MRNLYIILFAIMLLFIVFNAQVPVAEGFKSLPHVKQGNYVLDLLGRLTRTTKTLANPILWKDRMSMMGKSPVELAREYIKKQRAAA